MKKSRHCNNWQRKAVAVAVASCFVITSPVYANPIGADVVNGTVSMAQQGNALNITNSPGAIINWQSFSIGVSEATRFIQQSAASGVLNRVTGVDPSSILGTLQSNGRVFLINPNGVLFGAGAQVDVAGLVVSTLNLSNADFLAGRYNFTANANAGGIENQGSITALPGGQIYLVAPDINNSGAISSVNGDILLAAGNSVELVNASSPDMRVVISAPSNQAINLGSIVANSGRVGIYAGLVNHHGIVSADTAMVGATGKITFRATRDINLEPGSVISASGAPGGVHDGGEVRIVADGTLAMRQGARVSVDGGVDGGNGGFLELSGLTGLSLRGIYSGRAHKAGFRNGSLLLDPMNINITSGGSDGSGSLSASGQISASASSSASFNVDPTSLNNGGWADVSLAALNDITVSSPISNTDINNGAAGGSLTLTAGNDITVSAPIGTSGARFNHDLTLTAGNNVNINSSIYMGSNTLALAADATIPAQSISANGTGSVFIQPTALIPNPVVVETLGNLGVTGAGLQILGYNYNLVSSNAAPVTVNVGGVFSVNLTGEMRLEAGNATPNINWGDEDASVNLNVAGGDASNNNFITVGSLTIQGGSASACGGDCWNLGNADAVLSTTNNFVITTTAGGVTVQGGTASAQAGSGSADANANANLVAGGDMTLNVSGDITVQGGSIASADASGWGGSNTAIAHADAGILATGLLTVGNATLMTGPASLILDGGEGNNAYANGNGINTATATTNATVQAGSMDITLAGPLLVQGGSYAWASASSGGVNTATANADALLSATGLLTITNATGLTVQGGYGASASAYNSGDNTATATANATVQAGSMDITLSGPLLVQGGNGASADASWGSVESLTNNTAIVEANAKFHANGNANLTVNAGNVTIAGGDYASAEATEGYGVQQAQASANAELSAGGNIALTVSNGNLSVKGGDYASASVSDSSSSAQLSATANANAKLAAGNNLTLDVSGSVMVAGGNYASAGASGSGAGNLNTATTHADALLAAGGLLTMNAASLTIQGGSAAYASASDGGVNIATATANATVQAGTLNITLTGPLLVQGGTAANPHAQSGSANAVNTATVNADALLAATGALTIHTATGLTVQGGDWAWSSISGSGINRATTTANATVQAGTLDITLAGPLLAQGGSAGAGAWGGGGSNIATTHARAGISVTSDATITVTAGDMTVGGGSVYNSAGSAQAEYDASAVLSVGGIKTLNITAGSLLISGGWIESSGGIALAQAEFDPGAINANVAGDIMLTGGNALGAEAIMYSLGPVNLTIGGATGLSLTGTSGAGTGIFPDYNQPLSPITINFTGGGSVQPFIVTAGADAWIQSLYVVPPVVDTPSEATLLALNNIDNATDTTTTFGALDVTNPAGEENGDEDDPKKKLYTCQ